MSWLSDLLKNLTVSRTTAGALFIATLLLIFLPSQFPAYVHPVPNQWQWLVVGLCIFSGALLLFWATQGISRYIRKLPSAIRNAKTQGPSTDLEAVVLYIIGRDEPNGLLDLNYLNYDKVNHSKLEFLQACKALEKKGLVSIGIYNSDYVSLTDRGREIALGLLKSAKV